MPELPEVETVRAGLSQEILPGTQIKGLCFHREGLRSPFPKFKNHEILGQEVKAIRRRAKYLLFFLEDKILLSHLGMTGSWRFKSEAMKHDHVEIDLEDKGTLVYRDPRRFGQFDILSASDWQRDRRFIHLGPEPLDPQKFTAELMLEKSRGRKTPVKTFIMDQKVVVGVGNIYASEALFWSKIDPRSPACNLQLQDWQVLVHKIRDVLGDAIAFGGSTISDFRQAGGSQGYFQNHHFVYACADQPCAICEQPISSTVLAGRSTFWCSSCQVMR